MTINFQPGGPHELPLVRDASAKAIDETVQMTLHVLVGGKRIELVVVPMELEAAVDLHKDLAASIPTATKNVRNNKD